MRRVVKLHNVIDTRNGTRHDTVIVFEDIAKFYIPVEEAEEEIVDKKVEDDLEEFGIDGDDEETEIDDEIDEVEDEAEDEIVDDWLEREDGGYE